MNSIVNWTLANFSYGKLDDYILWFVILHTTICALRVDNNAFSPMSSSEEGVEASRAVHHPFSDSPYSYGLHSFKSQRFLNILTCR